MCATTEIFTGIDMAQRDDITTLDDIAGRTSRTIIPISNLPQGVRVGCFRFTCSDGLEMATAAPSHLRRCDMVVRGNVDKLESRTAKNGETGKKMHSMRRGISISQSRIKPRRTLYSYHVIVFTSSSWANAAARVTRRTKRRFFMNLAGENKNETSAIDQLGDFFKPSHSMPKDLYISLQRRNF